MKSIVEGPPFISPLSNPLGMGGGILEAVPNGRITAMKNFPFWLSLWTIERREKLSITAAQVLWVHPYTVPLISWPLCYTIRHIHIY